MKKIFLFSTIIAFMSFGFTSCSSSDDGGDDNNNSNTTFDVPMSIGNYWTYDVVGNNFTGRDSLYISKDTIISGSTFKKFETLNLPTGFYSTSLNNNGAKYENGKIYLSGTLNLSQSQNLPINFNASVSNLIVFNKDASSGTALNSSPVTGSLQQPVDFGGSTINLDIDYELQTYAGETLSNYTSPDGSSYTNVKSVQVKLNLVVAGAFGGITLPNILTNSEVMVSTLYFAEGIGMVHSNTHINVSVNSLVATQLGIQPTTSENQKEFLDTYQIN